MGVMYNGRTYSPEEVATMEDKTLQRKLLDTVQREFNGNPVPLDTDDLLNPKGGYIYNQDLVLEEDYIPTIEPHEIKNSEAARHYEKLLASGTDHGNALRKVKDLYKLDEDDVSDPVWNSMKEELEKRSDYPAGLKWKILSFAVTRGMSLTEAISEVTVNGIKYAQSIGNTPAKLSPELQKQIDFEKAYAAQQERMGATKVRAKLESRGK